MIRSIVRASSRMLALMLLWTAGTTSRAAPPGAPAPQDNPLQLDAKAMHEGGITLATAALRALPDVLSAPGEVVADAYATAVVSPRVAAQVVARKARLGDMVKAGQPLVVLSSVDVAETQGQFIVADQDWSRVKALGPQAVSARRYTESQVQRDQARAKLRAYGLSDAQIARLAKAGSSAADGTFELLSPREGRITSDAFMTGERIEPGRTMFTVVSESSVWVEARVPPDRLSQVRDGADVAIAAHGMTLGGRVVQQPHRTDEATRTAAVRVQVRNEHDVLHPGELVDTRIQVASSQRRLAVPVDAVVLLQNQATVFTRARADGPFEPTAVEVGDTRDGWVEIRQGLVPGVAYASTGAFVLKARLLRSQLGDE